MKNDKNYLQTWTLAIQIKPMLIWIVAYVSKLKAILSYVSLLGEENNVPCVSESGNSLKFCQAFFFKQLQFCLKTDIG